MSNSIFVACPVNVPYNILRDTVVELESMSKGRYIINHWDRESHNTYLPEWIPAAKAVVLILPDQAWKSRLDHLPAALLRELRVALQRNKKIFISYTPSHSLRPLIYAAMVDTLNGTIEGIKGTGDIIIEKVFSKERTSSTPCTKTKPIDITALPLLI